MTKTTKSARYIAWMLSIVVLVLCVVPAPKVIEVSNVDKLEHGLAFASLAFLFILAYPRQVVWVVLGCIGLGALIEAIQFFLPWRSAELADLMADVAGVVIGWLAAIFYTKLSRKSEHNE